jgi:Ca2+-binding RTX toxin-like protein
MRMRGGKTGWLAGIGGVLAGLALAPAALASTVTVTSGNTIRVAENGNEVNRISVSHNSGTDVYTVTDTAANLNPSAPCTPVNANTATCPGAGITRISVDTADRDDTITLDPGTIPSTVLEILDGGNGNDNVSGASGPGTLRGEAGNDVVSGRGTLEGGTGNDRVTGSPAADNVRGGSGRDIVDGGDGPDDISGGGNVDVLVYPASRVTPINVSLGAGNGNDGGAEDQGASGRDTARSDIDAVFGTPAGDVLIGDGSSETLLGFNGDDLLIGNGGKDTLGGFLGNDLMSGGTGGDTLRGSFGNDRLGGGPGDDRLAGGPDNDFLKGKRGSDVMKGKTGIDKIRAKDHIRDVKISCGPGPNRLESAKRDRRLDPRAKSC